MNNTQVLPTDETQPKNRRMTAAVIKGPGEV